MQPIFKSICKISLGILIYLGFFTILALIFFFFFFFFFVKNMSQIIYKKCNYVLIVKIACALINNLSKKLQLKFKADRIKITYNQ